MATAVGAISPSSAVGTRNWVVHPRQAEAPLPSAPRGRPVTRSGRPAHPPEPRLLDPALLALLQGAGAELAL